MSGSRKALSATLALALVAQQALAQETPYFRFQVGKGKDGATPDKVDPGTQDERALAFASADRVAGGPVGSPLSGRYVATGGKPSYAMTLTGAPPGLTLANAGGDVWTLSGAPGQVGEYTNALVTLTDSAGGVATFRTPMSITSADGTASTLSFASGDGLPSGIVGTRVRGRYFTATGGKAPYAMDLVDAPPGVTLSKVASDTWQAVGTLAAVGSYQSAVVRLVDAASSNATYPVPADVTAASRLSFASAQDFPASFPTNTLQNAPFAVTGGLAPYAVTLAQAPTTVLASGAADGNGNVVGVVEVPGAYHGVQVTVTDANGDSVSRTLADFTVTDNQSQALRVEGLDPLPETMSPGQGTSSQPKVYGTSDSHSVYATVMGGPQGFYSAFAFQMSYGTDPVQMLASLTPSADDIGKTFDVSVLFTDYGDQSRQKLVRWGRTTVQAPPFALAGQFPSEVSGDAGTSRTLYARVRGGARNASASVSVPAGLNGYAGFSNCGRYFCDPATGVADGEDLVTLDITFPLPGTYDGVRVVAEDVVTHERVYFDPIRIVSNKPGPLVKVSDFPTPIDLQGGFGSTYLDSIYARVKGGSPGATVSVAAPAGARLYTSITDCASSEYYCSNHQAAADEKLVEIYGYFPPAGTFEGIVATVSDAASDSSVSLAPVTVRVASPPLGSCALKPIQSLDGKATTVANALTFSGGQAPFDVQVAGVDGITLSTPVGNAFGAYASSATAAAGSAGGTATVTVRDAKGDTCAPSTDVTSYRLSSGDAIPLTIVRYNTYGNEYQTSNYVTGDATPFDVYVTPGFKSPYGTGPVGAHPDPASIYMRFVPPGGASVTGYSVESQSAPDGILLLTKYAYDTSYGNYSDEQTALFSNVLVGQGYYELPTGDYRYRYNVYLSDGTYRLSDFVTVHVQ